MVLPDHFALAKEKKQTDLENGNIFSCNRPRAHKEHQWSSEERRMNIPIPPHSPTKASYLLQVHLTTEVEVGEEGARVLRRWPLLLVPPLLPSLWTTCRKPQPAVWRCPHPLSSEF